MEHFMWLKLFSDSIWNNIDPTLCPNWKGKKLPRKRKIQWYPWWWHLSEFYQFRLLELKTMYLQCKWPGYGPYC